jgi:chloramphenicol 3-O phosphotransferase
MERRRNTWGTAGSPPDPEVPRPVQMWQREVHIPGIYDLELDTATLNPTECAEIIRRQLDNGPLPTAFQLLAEMSSRQD